MRNLFSYSHVSPPILLLGDTANGEHLNYTPQQKRPCTPPNHLFHLRHNIPIQKISRFPYPLKAESKDNCNSSSSSCLPAKIGSAKIQASVAPLHSKKGVCCIKKQDSHLHSFLERRFEKHRNTLRNIGSNRSNQS